MHHSMEFLLIKMLFISLFTFCVHPQRLAAACGRGAVAPQVWFSNSSRWTGSHTAAKL